MMNSIRFTDFWILRFGLLSLAHVMPLQSKKVWVISRVVYQYT